MRSAVPTVPLLVLIALATFLSASFAVPTVSACSLASPAPWLQFVLDHGLATITPDCRLVWQTGVVTDLNGNMISSPTYLFVQQFGVVFFVVGVVLTLVGAYLVCRAKRLGRPKNQLPATA